MVGFKEQFEQMKKQCIYCRIVSKEVDSNIIWQDEDVTAFTDIMPANKGHITIIPTQHHQLFSGTPPKVLSRMFAVAHKLMNALKKTIASTSYSVFIPVSQVAGQVVNHACIQLIPREKNDGIKSFEIDSKDIDETKWTEVNGKFKQIYPLMIGNVGKKKQPIPKEQLIGILKQNSQLIDFYKEDSEGFKIQVELNAQLRNLFEEQDIDAIMMEAQNE